MRRRMIDNYVGGSEQWRQFYVWKGEKTLSPEVRGSNAFQLPYTSSYVRYGSQSLIIPDLLEVDSIKVDGSDVTDNFNLEPRNSYPKVQIATKRSSAFLLTGRLVAER